MQKRALFFTQPYVLSLRNCQLVVATKEMPSEQRTVPIEDIGYVILEHPQIKVTLPLLSALSEANVAVVVCGENRLPCGMMLNLDSNATQGERFRAQVAVSEPLKKNLWKQVVEAKIRNQGRLLDKLGKRGELLKPYWQNVKSGDADNREGIASRIYWQELFGKDFVRMREGGPPNRLLNYGYTILRAAAARALMGSGLLPAFGIFHRNRYNAFPLADDMMEPYRPFVDEMVYEMWRSGASGLDKEGKGRLLGVLFVDTHFKKMMRPLDIGLTLTSASLWGCFSGERKLLTLPDLK